MPVPSLRDQGHTVRPPWRIVAREPFPAECKGDGLVSWRFVSASAARRAAFEFALRIDRDAAFADELLHSQRASRLAERERSFLTELLLGCLRRRGELDAALSARLRKPLEAMDAEVVAALRLGAYQMRYMGSVPDHAAVSESVELVKLSGKRSASGLVNAVLRRLPPAPQPAEAALLNHPQWMVRRWEASFGRKGCAALLRANLERPPAYFRIPAPIPPVPALRRLERAGIAVEPTPLPRAFRLVSGSAGAAREAAGTPLAFQDINSQSVATLLDAGAGLTVLDVCAAPGGKARLLAEATTVVASDRHLHRLRTLRRLGCRGIQAVALDARHPLPFRQRFDRVLVDAPCSGTGTLARNPEIKWRLQPCDIDELGSRQVRILGSALDALAPGGILVYATCSLEPEENENVVEAALGARPDWPASKVLSAVPGRDPGDGFQAWRIHRPAE